MVSDDEDRDAVLRAKLVARATDARSARTRPVRLAPARWYAGLVTAVVLVAVVALSIAALRFGNDRGGPAAGGSSTAAAPDSSSVEVMPPEETLPPGKLLARFTSDDGPNQDHTIQVGGYAIATQFVCTGQGTYSVFVAGGTGESGDGGCSGGGVGAGGVDITGTTKVRIRTDADMRWTYTLIGITPPPRITLAPIPTPTDSSGTSVPYCSGDDLTVRYVSTPDPDTGYAGSGELVFTNETNRTCALAGFPEVRFLSSGEPLGHNTMNQYDRAGSTKNGLEAVIVAPGKSAYSQVSWYLPGENSKSEGACVKRAVTAVEVDLQYDLAAPEQTGTYDVPIGSATACLNGEHGALGKYGQISSTVFLDYSRQLKG